MLCGFVSTTTAILDKGKLVTLDGIGYWVGSTAVSGLSSSRTLNWNWTASDIVPLTIIQTNATDFTSSDLDETIAKFTASDDVFSPGFLEGMFLPRLLLAKVFI